MGQAELEIPIGVGGAGVGDAGFIVNGDLASAYLLLLATCSRASLSRGRCNAAARPRKVDAGGVRFCNYGLGVLV